MLDVLFEVISAAILTLYCSAVSEEWSNYNSAVKVSPVFDSSAVAFVSQIKYNILLQTDKNGEIVKMLKKNF